MKALLRNDFLLLGFGYPLSEYGFDIAIWNGPISEYDIFDREEPNIIFANSHDLTPAFIKCLNEKPNVITILFDKDEHKHSLNPLKWTFYVIPERKKDLPIEGINLQEYQQIILPPMVDTKLFFPVDKDPLLECDLGVWGPQNDIVYSMCYPIGKLNIKIFGPDPWSQPQYMGMTSHENRLRLYRSAKVCWVHNIDEALRIAACKGVMISNKKEVSEVFGNVNINNAQDLIELFAYWEKSGDEYEVLSDLGYKKVTEKYTYQIGWNKLLKEIS